MDNPLVDEPFIFGTTAVFFYELVHVPGRERKRASGTIIMSSPTRKIDDLIS